MKNFIVPGKSIPWTNTTGSTVFSGGVAVIGSGIGIAMRDIPDGATETVELYGAYELPIDNGNIVHNPTILQGSPVWWDATHQFCIGSNVGGAHPFAGVIFRTQQAAVTSASVLLCPFFTSQGAGVITQAAIPTIATANATDLPTAEALANQNKVTVNLILVALRAAGVILP